MNALATPHDASVQMIDTSIVRVHQHGACVTRNRRQSMGRSRGGLTSKIHAVVDTNGLPVQLALTAGEAHDNRLAGKLLSRLKSGTMLLADRGYDADWIRALAAERGASANIPPKCNRNGPICFSPYLYRARNLIERFFNKVKQCRRVATRYDKLAANYLAFVQLASIRLWLRVNEYTALNWLRWFWPALKHLSRPPDVSPNGRPPRGLAYFIAGPVCSARTPYYANSSNNAFASSPPPCPGHARGARGPIRRA